MRLEQLKYFLEVSKTNSIRAAAENLFISSPALGTAIQTLEKELGFPLFERQRSGVSLTAYGQEALPLATQILNLSNKFHWIQTQYQHSLQENLTGNFTISIVIAANLNFMHDIIPLFSKTYPQINLTVIEQSTDFVLNSVLENRSDLGILFTDEKSLNIIKSNYNFSDFILQPLYKETMYALVHPSSPLANKKQLTLKELSSCPLALTCSTQEDNSTYERLFSKFPDVKTVVRSNSVNLILQYLNHTDIVGLSFSNIIPSYPDAPTAIPIQDVLPFSICAFYNQKSQKFPVINAFLKIIREFHDF